MCTRVSDNERRSFDACPTISVSLVVPVYNEAETVGPFLDRVERMVDGESSVRLEVVFVNDGSSDATLERLLEHQQQDTRVRVVDLSRNFGKEAALTAGMRIAKGQVVVPIDVDLQAPPELIFEMIEQWRQGYDVVLARRVGRDTDSRAKRISATWFYRIYNRIAEPMIPENVSDFRLMDRTVVEALNELPESRRFMKGLFAWVGFRTTCVDYACPERAAGSSKFNGRRLWNFALEGLTGFSTLPLRIWTYLGTLMVLASFLYASFIVLRVLIFGIDTPGYVPLLVAITFLGGLQLMGIGIIGEYLGRTYLEAKRRPVFLVRHIYEPQE
ncbi:glycosyltransferase family 2 protein [Candidatus Thiosymbion oneisti]|uniref:glycosyltransferase family 2 protein n=1 Tax=Candidatus Thiosymbion oneisti TaxID=589554 RepID=UPI000AAA49F9|nr:glycosyltransferase family 2 protein [Candidatus Thiosymbion oneisti]